MRPNRRLIRKLENPQRQHRFLYLFQILLVFSSFVVIHAGVVRREIVDKIDKNNNSSSGSSSSSNSGSSSINDSYNDDDIFTDAGANTVGTTTIAAAAAAATTASTSTLVVKSTTIRSSSSSAENATLRPLAIVTLTTNGNGFSIPTTTTRSGTPSTPGIVTTAATVSPPPPLPIAKVAINDIKKSHISTTIVIPPVQNNKKSIHTEGTTPEVNLESTTAPGIESQPLQVTTIDTVLTTETKERRGKSISIPTDPLAPVIVEKSNTGAVIRDGIAFPPTTKASTTESYRNHGEIEATTIVRESSSISDKTPSDNNNVIKIHKSAASETGASANINNNSNFHHSQNILKTTTENVKITDVDDTTTIPTELPHSNYNSFDENTEKLFEQTVTEATTISNDYEKYLEDLTESKTVSESFISSTSYDHSLETDNEDEDTTTFSEFFDSTTTDSEDTKRNHQQIPITTTTLNTTIKNISILNPKFDGKSNYDISVNEIKNSSSNPLNKIPATGIAAVITPTTRRSSKFIKGEANLTIPDAAEVWALASLKNVVDNNNNSNKNTKGNENDDSVEEKNTNSTLKSKSHRNETTLTKSLADWSKIMKEVEIKDINNDGSSGGGDGNKGNITTKTDKVNSVENTLENIVKTDSEKGKTHEQLEEPESRKTISTTSKPNIYESSTTSLSPSFPPTKLSSSSNNETLQRAQNVSTLSSVDEHQKRGKQENPKIEDDTVDKNQVDDMEKLHSHTTKTATTIPTTTTTVASSSAAKTTTPSATTISSSNRDHLLLFTLSDSSPNKVSSTETGVNINKGTPPPNYKETTAAELSSYSLTTEPSTSSKQTTSQILKLNSTTTQPTTTTTLSSHPEDTTIGNNSEQTTKSSDPTESGLSSSSLPSTEINLIQSTTVRIPRTTITTVPGKIVTKESTKEPTFNESEFSTGPENSIESNTIDRVSTHTTPSSEQSEQDSKVAPTVSGPATTAKINAYPVDTNSVEHLGHGSTIATVSSTTHKTIPTKAEQEYSIHNVSSSYPPKVLEPTTEFSLPPVQHSTHGPHHIGGSMSSDDMPNMPEEPDYNVIIAISISVVGIIALILLVGFLYVMRKRQKQLTYGQRCRPVSLDAYSLDNVSVYNSVRRKGALRASKRSYGNVAFDDPALKHNLLGVQDLAKFVERKSTIHEEFKDVPQIIARPDEVPPGCEDKNRYANVIPLPETRVILQRQNDDEKTEYINANYVRGPKDAPNYYIACQAPLESTVNDFWRMIWEQNSRVIIMATDFIENGIEKCAEYFPQSLALDNHSQFGDYQITLKCREVKDKYAVSVLNLKNTTTNVWREITHFWYQWPETGVPTDEAGVIAMLLEARSCLKASPIDQTDNNSNDENNENSNNDTKTTTTVATTNGSVEKLVKSSQKTQGPLTVHCSPGTGRTGTIIACDIVLRSLETPKRSVDIPQIVYYVRRGRASAIQTKEQYEFIYRVANMYASKISGPINDN